MKQYIDKSALIEWIKEKKIPFKKDIDNGVYPTYYCALMDFEDFLDTLEVKEVDLKKELNNFIEQQNAFIKDDRVVEYDNGDSFNHIYDLEEIAKHFFELGLKAKGE